jgi:ComF family protein
MPSTGHLSGQFQGLGKAVLDLLFPPRCAACKRIGEIPLCSSCVAEFTPVGSVVCPVCGDLGSGPHLCRQCRERRPAFTCVYSGFRFEGRLRQAIHALKYSGRQAVAVYLVDALVGVLSPPDSAAFEVCAVPLHADREAQRGFNQAALLAAGLAVAWGMPYLGPAALRRIRATDTQIGLDYVARRANVQGAFAADPALVSGRHILLVDDVCTTGATLDACAGALLAAGAGTVVGVTLARA